MTARAILATLGLCLASAAYAGPTSVDLSLYQHTATINLGSLAAEASAVTFNPDTGSLFVLGDEGDAIVEVGLDGVQRSSMTLTGFDDTEGLTYLGGGRFAIGEERLQDIYELNYTAGGTVARGSLRTASVGPTVGNIGIEGFSYDPRNDRFIMVKEKSPQAIYDAAVTFTGPPAGPDINPSSLFDPALLGVLDLSDVQVLATVPSLAGTADEDNLLIYSQESARLLEVTRDGTILSSFDFSAIASDAEGVTIDHNGVIYVAGETPALYVLTPVPAPGPLALSALIGVLGARRRRA